MAPQQKHPRQSGAQPRQYLGGVGSAAVFGSRVFLWETEIQSSIQREDETVFSTVVLFWVHVHGWRVRRGRDNEATRVAHGQSAKVRRGRREGGEGGVVTIFLFMMQREKS